MTETHQPSLLESLWAKRPRVIKVIVHPGRPAYISLETWQAHPLPTYPEWIIAWGGRWRWHIRRAS